MEIRVEGILQIVVQGFGLSQREDFLELSLFYFLYKLTDVSMFSENFIKSCRLFFVRLGFFFVDVGASLDLANEYSFFLIVHIEEFNQSTLSCTGRNNSIEIFLSAKRITDKRNFDQNFVNGVGQIEQLMGEITVILVGVQGQVNFEQSFSDSLLFKQLIKHQEYFFHLLVGIELLVCVGYWVFYFERIQHLLSLGLFGAIFQSNVLDRQDIVLLGIGRLFVQLLCEFVIIFVVVLALIQDGLFDGQQFVAEVSLLLLIGFFNIFLTYDLIHGVSELFNLRLQISLLLLDRFFKNKRNFLFSPLFARQGLAW